MKTTNDFPNINERPPEGRKDDGTSFRVLVVDDSMFVAKQLGQILSSEGYEIVATAADGNDWTMSALELNYDNIVRYLGFEDCGKILATFCYLKPDIINSNYPNMAYELGKSL